MRFKIAGLTVLVVGTGIMLLGGIPDFLLKLEVAAICGTAMLHGYTGFNPRVPAWANSRPVQGVACVWLGVAAMLIPLNFLASGWLLGNGIRLVMTGFTTVTVTPATSIDRKTGDIVLRPTGQVVKG